MASVALCLAAVALLVDVGALNLREHDRWTHRAPPSLSWLVTLLGSGSGGEDRGILLLGCNIPCRDCDSGRVTLWTPVRGVARTRGSVAVAGRVAGARGSEAPPLHPPHPGTAVGAETLAGDGPAGGLRVEPEEDGLDGEPIRTVRHAGRGVPPAAVRACTWYFRLLLKWAVAGVIVGVRSLSERSKSPERQYVLGLRARGAGSEGGCFAPSHGGRRVGPDSMSISVPSTPAAGTPGDPGESRAASLETLIARLVAQQASGRIGYWAAFTDERGVGHLAFTTDPAYAELSPENAASRTRAVAGFNRAIERYRASLAGFRPAP